MTRDSRADAAPLDWSGHLTLGGASQQVRILSADRTLPALVVLHGGPGMPNGRAFLLRHQALARHFTLVTWDQRGSGGSVRGAGPAPLTLDRLVRDAAGLVDMVVAGLRGVPVVVLGLSWGSELGVRLVQRHPGGIAGFVGSGQAVAGHEGERRSYDWARDQARHVADDVHAPAGDRRLARWHLEVLRAVGPARSAQYRPVLAGLALQRRVLDHYTRRLLASLPGPDAPVEGSAAPPSSAPPGAGPARPAPRGRPAVDDEAWGERVGRTVGMVRSLHELWPTVTHYDFRADAAELAVPVAFLQGRHDHTTPSSLVQEYADVLRAPSVDLTWFERSAHSPATTQAADFERRLVAVTSRWLTGADQQEGTPR